APMRTARSRSTSHAATSPHAPRAPFVTWTTPAMVSTRTSSVCIELWPAPQPAAATVAVRRSTERIRSVMSSSGDGSDGDGPARASRRRTRRMPVAFQVLGALHGWGGGRLVAAAHGYGAGRPVATAHGKGAGEPVATARRLR